MSCNVVCAEARGGAPNNLKRPVKPLHPLKVPPNPSIIRSSIHRSITQLTSAFSHRFGRSIVCTIETGLRSLST